MTDGELSAYSHSLPHYLREKPLVFGRVCITKNRYHCDCDNHDNDSLARVALEPRLVRE